jgi:predicted dehydrogenase
MPGKLKWGILGNATIGRKCVIPAVQKSSNGQVHILATRSPARAHNVITDNRIPNLCDSYDKLLEDPAVEVVYIPLPNHLHYPWTLKALSAGKHVLCEKPLSCAAHEAQEMVDAAHDKGLFLMEAFMFRFHPRSQRIKAIVDSGAIGKPCLIRAAFCYHMDDNVLKTAGNPRLKPEMGGGALLDVGCYGVSAARWLMQEEPTQVQALAVYHPKGVDIHLVGTLLFPGGQLAVVEASFICALQQTFTVVGNAGAIELPHDAFIPWEKDAIFWLRGRDQEIGEKHVIPGADQYQLMVEYFGDVVLGKAKPGNQPADSVANMHVLDALAEAARTGETVKLKT